MLKQIILSFSIILFTSSSFTQTVVTPAPPVTLTGKGVKSNYSSQDYEIPRGGKVIIQYWTTRFFGPKYTWIIKQASLVITPPKDADIEDMAIWLQNPNRRCELMDWLPKLNGKGITLAASINLDKDIGVNLGGEVTVGADGVEIEKAPGLRPGPNEGWWYVDWDDFSDAAESKAVLHFYAKWRCPKNCKCSLAGNQDAKSSFISIEFDEYGIDEPYILSGGKTLRKRELKNRKKVKKTASAWTPPAGETRIAAVGTVRDEKVTMTSRGGSIGGTVSLENEEGEELAVAVPDEKGKFAIDFRDITSLAVASTLVLTQLDSEGNAETSTKIEYMPGTPTEWPGPPIVTQPEVTFIQNHQLVDLEGGNFGERPEVIIADEQGDTILQETVSSSMNLTQYYMDAPVGAAEVVVMNDFGSSEPLEIGIYEFSVRAGKMDLVRNEKTSITASYEGLPEGTKIIFTNLSPNVTVKPNGNGKASGDDITYIVKRSTGEVSMTLKAKQAGGWMLNYRLEFPVSDE